MKLKERKYQFYYPQFEKESPRKYIPSKTESERKSKSQIFVDRAFNFKVESFESLAIKPGSFISCKGTREDMIPRTMALFAGDVLDGQDDYKEYLAEVIQSKIGGRIDRTRLIFKYDPLRPRTSIHQYIDEKANLLLVVKTCLGFSLAAFSEAAVVPKNMSDGLGLIVSLTNRRCFELFPGKKAVKYDNQYLIFGNSEIRVGANEKKIFSNFGVGNAHFDSRKEGVNIILGEGQRREVQVQDFQIFQLLFK